jgi:hypothetical protein
MKIFTMLFFVLMLMECDDEVDCAECMLAQVPYVKALNSGGVTSAYRTEYNNVLRFCGKTRTKYVTDNFYEEDFEYGCND